MKFGIMSLDFKRLTLEETFQLAQSYGFDGVEIYRSTKKNRFGKKPFYATKGGKSAGYYINSKSLKSGVTYYYKVRGYVLIDGQKHYTDLSLKAIRTVK